VDFYRTGWNWIQDNFNGLNLVDMFGQGENWIHNHMLVMNDTDTEVDAPAAPANVTTSLDTVNGCITISWDDVDDVNCAYNVVVVTPSGKVISNLPVNPLTGFIKVGDNKQIAIRPEVGSYTLPYNEMGEYKMGVQAVSLNNEKASAIAWGPSLSGIGNISTDLSNTNVKVTVNGNTIVANADAGADVKVVDMMGRTVATGVTNAPINVEANGVFIVTVAGKSVKVVK
ncbi:MAG: hypothetical protein K2G06_05595, partial [Muribaculaceae bacterium]|nr:hypothetical protein [Muribaculaceae bacterium]